MRSNCISFWHPNLKNLSMHRMDTQPEVGELRVGAFDVFVLVFSGVAIFLASVHGKCFTLYRRCWSRFYDEKQFVERGQWIRMLYDSSNVHKQKLVKPTRTSGWVSSLWPMYARRPRKLCTNNWNARPCKGHCKSSSLDKLIL